MMVSHSDYREYGRSSCDVTHRLVMEHYEADSLDQENLNLVKTGETWLELELANVNCHG